MRHSAFAFITRFHRAIVCLVFLTAGFGALTIGNPPQAMATDPLYMNCGHRDCFDGMTFHFVQPQFAPNQLTPPGMRQLPKAVVPQTDAQGVPLPSATSPTGTTTTTDGSVSPASAMSPATAAFIANQAPAPQLYMNDPYVNTSPKVSNGIFECGDCQCADPDFCDGPPSCYNFSFEADIMSFTRTDPKLGNALPGLFGGTLATGDSLDSAVGPRARLLINGADCYYNAEIIYWGTQSWQEQGTYTTNALVSPLEFTAEIHNAEWNYRRRCSPMVAWSIGFRYLELHERITFDRDNAGDTESVLLASDNFMYGAQFGNELLLWGRDCFKVELISKAGIFSNNSHLSDVIIGPTGAVVTNLQNRSYPTGYVGDVGLFTTYNMSRQCTIRGGYEAIWIDGLALATDAPTNLNQEHTLFVHAAMLGLELRF